MKIKCEKPWGRVLRALLFPPPALMVLLVPLCAVGLMETFVRFESSSWIAIAIYAISAYTLTVLCLRTPATVRWIRRFRQENRHMVRWQTNTRLRVTVSLYASLTWNVAYAVFQLILGLYHQTIWYGSLAGYYGSLALMRFCLAQYSRSHRPGDQPIDEWRRYRVCGWIFLVMNLLLTPLIFSVVLGNHIFHHHEITTIAMAAYTFVSFTVALIGLIRYRAYHAPVYSASKAISLTTACVSMLTLAATMLTTFGEEGGDELTRLWTLGLLGGAVLAFILTMALHMIRKSTKQIKAIQKMKEDKHMEEQQFQYTYSADEQEKVKKIREKYTDRTEGSMERLRRLDRSVSHKAQAVALSFGIIGALILGFGMSLIMSDLGAMLSLAEDFIFPIGLGIGVVGSALVVLAYPLHRWCLKRERKKIAPEVLRLTDELMK